MESVHQVTQWRTDGVHRRECAGTGPAKFFKVARVAGTAASGVETPWSQNVVPSFSTPTINIKITINITTTAL